MIKVQEKVIINGKIQIFPSGSFKKRCVKIHFGTVLKATDIKTLKNSKNSAPNSISTKVLKIIKKSISAPLSRLINKSFSNGTFANVCKLVGRYLLSLSYIVIIQTYFIALQRWGIKKLMH